MDQEIKPQEIKCCSGCFDRATIAAYATQLIVWPVDGDALVVHEQDDEAIKHSLSISRSTDPCDHDNRAIYLIELLEQLRKMKDMLNR